MLKLFQNTLYFRIEPELIVVTHVESGHKIADKPVLAIETRKGKSVIVAHGKEANALAGQSNISINNGFLHPRTLLADFLIAQLTLKYLVKKIQPKTWFVPSPVIVLHPLKLLEGGLTQIEIRAFAELGSMAGARRVYVWSGPELTCEELIDLDFSRAGGQLLFP
jgi:rod shape-determining protein MreB